MSTATATALSQPHPQTHTPDASSPSLAPTPSPLTPFVWSHDKAGPPPSFHAAANPSAYFVNHPEVLSPATASFSGSIPTYLSHHPFFRVGLGRRTAPHADGVLWEAPHGFEFLSMATSFRFSNDSNTVTILQRLNCQHVLDVLHATKSSDYTPVRLAFTGRSLWEMIRSFRPLTMNPVTKQPLYSYGVLCERIPGLGLVARTDAAVAQKLDCETLEPGKEVTFESLSPLLKGCSNSPSHGVYDPETKEYFNVAWDLPVLPRDATYRVFAMNERAETRVLASFRAATTLLHSLVVTKKYVIILLPPMRLLVPLMILSLSVGDALRKVGYSRLIVIPRDGGGKIAEFRPEFEDDENDASGIKGNKQTEKRKPFSAVHICNAWDIEDGDDDSVIIEAPTALPLDEIFQHPVDAWEEPLDGNPNIVQMKVPNISKALGRDDGVATVKEICRDIGELPTINPNYKMQAHRYTYVVGHQHGLLNSRVSKVDNVSGDFRSFSMPNTIFDEPLFVPDPDGTDEDDGVILLLGFDSAPEREVSIVCVLQAKNLEVAAVAELPARVPMAFHWYMDIKEP